MQFSISRRALIAGTAATIGAAVLALAPLTTSAHEHRAVGNYQFIVGFVNEPTIAGQLNGVDLRVSEPSPATPGATPAAGDTGVPVTGLESTLKVDVIYNTATTTLSFEPTSGTPGRYHATFIPTLPGDYSFRIYGTINGTSVDETFTSGPDTFDSVADPATLEFPPATPGAN